MERDRSQCQHARLGTHDKLIEHDAKNEKQRIEQLYRGIQLHVFLQHEAGLERRKQMRGFSAGQQAQFFTGLSQPGYELCFRQVAECTKGSDTPHGEGFRMLWGKVEHCEGQGGERGGFHPSWYHTDTCGCMPPCQAPGGMKVAADRDRCPHAKSPSLFKQALSQSIRRTE